MRKGAERDEGDSVVLNPPTGTATTTRAS